MRSLITAVLVLAGVVAGCGGCGDYISVDFEAKNYYVPSIMLNEDPPKPPPTYEVPSPELIHVDLGSQIPAGWKEYIRSKAPNGKIEDKSIVFLGRGERVTGDPFLGLASVPLSPERSLVERDYVWVRHIYDDSGPFVVTDAYIFAPRLTYLAHKDGQEYTIDEDNPILVKEMFYFEGQRFTEAQQYWSLDPQVRDAIRSGVFEVWVYSAELDDFTPVTRFTMDITYASRLLVGGIWWDRTEAGEFIPNFRPGYDN